MFDNKKNTCIFAMQREKERKNQHQSQFSVIFKFKVSKKNRINIFKIEDYRLINCHHVMHIKQQQCSIGFVDLLFENAIFLKKLR